MITVKTDGFGVWLLKGNYFKGTHDLRAPMR